MSFFSRLSNGWEMAKVSLATINENRSLLLFPVMSTISIILILLTFFGGGFFLFADQLESAFADETTANIVLYVGIFIYYLINFFIVVFFNSALIHCAMLYFDGEEPTMSDGLNYATSKIGQIFGWAVVSATVGVLLQIIQNTGKIGEFISSLIGVAWSILTFFVVPVLIYEDKNVFDSIKESGRLMKEKWGESLGANVGFGLFHFLGILLGIGIIFGFMAIEQPIIGIVIGGLGILLISTIVSAAQTVFVAAVYNHVKGRPTGNFDSNILDDAFMGK